MASTAAEGGHRDAWDAWFASACDLQMSAWRGVEAQHIVATMRLVDSLAEQALLEQILEDSKPPLPTAGPPGGARAVAPAAAALQPAGPEAPAPHFLLSTPFRYRSPTGSRFRKPGAAGVWYGAATLQAAAAEVGYWRWRFLMASDGLRSRELLTEHTFFQAQVRGSAIDLTAPPWSAQHEAWTRDADYSATQALAAAAAARGLAWIRYASVRHPGDHCAAVLRLQALALPVGFAQQTWHCKATAERVMLVHGADRFEWRFGVSAS